MTDLRLVPPLSGAADDGQKVNTEPESAGIDRMPAKRATEAVVSHIDGPKGVLSVLATDEAKRSPRRAASASAPPGDPWDAEIVDAGSGPTVSMLSRLREVWTPPALWTEGLPPLRELWLYAVAGQWTRTDVRTPVRVLGVIYGAPVLAVSFLGYLALWIAARPTRFLVAIAIALLIFLVF